MTAEELKAQIGTMQRQLEEFKRHADSLRPWAEWVEAQNVATQQKLGSADAQMVAVRHMLLRGESQIGTMQREIEGLNRKLGSADAQMVAVRHMLLRGESQIGAVQREIEELKTQAGSVPEGAKTVGTIRAAEAGIGLGSVVAVILSFTLNHSVGWAILHGICSWFYVIYRIWEGNY